MVKLKLHNQFNLDLNSEQCKKAIRNLINDTKINHKLPFYQKKHKLRAFLNLSPNKFVLMSPQPIFPIAYGSKKPNFNACKNIFGTNSFNKINQLYQENKVNLSQYIQVIKSGSYGIVGNQSQYLGDNQLITLDIDSEKHHDGHVVNQDVIKDIKANLFKDDFVYLANRSQSGGLHLYISSNKIGHQSIKNYAYRSNQFAFKLDIKPANSYVVLQGKDYGKMQLDLDVQSVLDYGKAQLADALNQAKFVKKAPQNESNQDNKEENELDIVASLVQRGNAINGNLEKANQIIDDIFKPFELSTQLYILLGLAELNQVNVFPYQNIDKKISTKFNRLKKANLYDLRSYATKAAQNKVAITTKKQQIDKLNNVDINAILKCAKNQSSSNEVTQPNVKQVDLKHAKVAFDKFTKNQKNPQYRANQKTILKNFIQDNPKAFQSNEKLAEDYQTNAKDDLVVANPTKPNFIPKINHLSGMESLDLVQQAKDKSQNDGTKAYNPLNKFHMNIVKYNLNRFNITHFTDNYVEGMRNDSLVSVASVLYASNYTEEEALALILKLDHNSNDSLAKSDGKNSIRTTVHQAYKVGGYRFSKDVLKNVFGIDVLAKTSSNDHFTGKSGGHGKGVVPTDFHNDNPQKGESNQNNNFNHHNYKRKDGRLLKEYHLNTLINATIIGFKHFIHGTTNDFIPNTKGFFKSQDMVDYLNYRILDSYKYKRNAVAIRNVLREAVVPISKFTTFDLYSWFIYKLESQRFTKKELKQNASQLKKIEKLVSEVTRFISVPDLFKHAKNFSKLFKENQQLLGYLTLKNIVELTSLNIITKAGKNGGTLVSVGSQYFDYPHNLRRKLINKEIQAKQRQNQRLSQIHVNTQMMTKKTNLSDFQYAKGIKRNLNQAIKTMKHRKLSLVKTKKKHFVSVEIAYFSVPNSLVKLKVFSPNFISTFLKKLTIKNVELQSQLVLLNGT